MQILQIGMYVCPVKHRIIRQTKKESVVTAQRARIQKCVFYVDYMLLTTTYVTVRPTGGMKKDIFNSTNLAPFIPPAFLSVH